MKASTIASAAAERVPPRHPAESELLELGGFLPEETPKPPHAFAKLNPSDASIDLDSDEAPEAPPPPRRDSTWKPLQHLLLLPLDDVFTLLRNIDSAFAHHYLRLRSIQHPAAPPGI